MYKPLKVWYDRGIGKEPMNDSDGRPITMISSGVMKFLAAVSGSVLLTVGLLMFVSSAISAGAAVQ